ncbi:MAG: C13 family peptidase [Prevotella sp.]|nr:C13 family peptidase [Prevotella sp.]
MKKTLFPLLLMLLFLAARAQSVSPLDQLKADPRKAYGNDYPYRLTMATMTPAPEGYVPFYISHYGRHGSRYYWNDRLYKQLDSMLTMETCFSGKWGEALTGQPDVLVLTAATPYETSKADAFDEDLGVFLSNAFARTFRKKINEDPSISIYDIYKELFLTTNGSHVTIYNESKYGSVYDNRMTDYFPLQYE